MATAFQERLGHAPSLNTAMAHLATELRAATVEVQVEGHGNGSGVIWRQDGLIVTNSHVARGESVEVVLQDGRAVPGKVFDRSDDYDLAAVRIAADGLQAAPIGDSSQLRVGELVLAMGHPLGVRGALTIGIVHMVPSSPRPAGDERWIRADLSLLPGNSGGPMADANGRVVGINSMVAGGLALAVPSNVVERFVAGKIAPAYLGVVTQLVQLGDGLATRSNAGQSRGLMVLSVAEGGPAARNGLLPGDILMAAGGQRLTTYEALIAVLRTCTAGTPLSLTILRGGVMLDLTAILGARDTETE
jgi:serine protease Do